MRKLDRILKKGSDFTEKIEDIKDFLWYNPISKYHKYKEMLERVFYWAYHMRWSWDFDAHSMYRMNYLKLKRIHDCMKNHSHCVWNDSESTNLMRKLCEAKHLAKRLDEFDYGTQAFIETDNRYKYKSWFTPIENSTSSRYNSKWVNEPENAKLYLQARRKHYHKMKLTDKKRLFYLLDKYIEQWWD